MSDRDDTPLNQHTRRVWEPRAGRDLTGEDCREIQRNIFGFLQVLRDWAKSDDASSPATSQASETTHNPEKETNE